MQTFRDLPPELIERVLASAEFGHADLSRFCRINATWKAEATVRCPLRYFAGHSAYDAVVALVVSSYIFPTILVSHKGQQLHWEPPQDRAGCPGPESGAARSFEYIRMITAN